MNRSVTMTTPESRRPAGRVVRVRRLAAVAMVVGVAALAAEPAAADEAGLALSGPYMRLIIPARPAAGYFTLENTGDAARALVGAESPGCGSIMLHKSESKNGVETMMPVASVPVPAHQSISFAPGGYHLMCMAPTASLKPGGSVPVTLKFEDGGTLTGDFPVRGVGE
jgi:periplasmic copper chaperone A